MSILAVPYGRLRWGNLVEQARLNRVAGAAALLALGLFIALAPLEITLVLLMGSGLALLILLRPVVGLCLLALVLPFSQMRQLSLAGARVGAAEALLGLTLAAWLARMAARRTPRPPSGGTAPLKGGRTCFPHPPLLLPFLAFIGAQLLSLLASRSLRESLPELLKWVEMLTLYLFIASEVKRRHVPWIIGATLVAGSAQALLGTYQFLRQVGPEPFILMGRFMRAYGTFNQPNPYAGYLGLIAPLALSLALWALGCVWEGLRHGPRRLPPDMARRWAALGLFGGTAALLVAGIGMSWSRGAWLGLAAGAVVVSALRSRRAMMLFLLLVALACALAILGGFGLLPGALTGRLAGLGEHIQYATDPDMARVEITDANFAVLERVAHWRAAWGMFSDHPWLGVGIGNYAVAYPAYALPRWSDPLGHAHNIYLHFLAETGLLGLVTYLLFWIMAMAQAWKAKCRRYDYTKDSASLAHCPKESDINYTKFTPAPESMTTRSASLHSETQTKKGVRDGYAKAIAIGVLGVIAHLTVHSLVDNLYVQGIYLHIAILLGVLEVQG